MGRVFQQGKFFLCRLILSELLGWILSPSLVQKILSYREDIVASKECRMERPIPRRWKSQVSRIRRHSNDCPKRSSRAIMNCGSSRTWRMRLLTERRWSMWRYVLRRVERSSRSESRLSWQTCESNEDSSLDQLIDWLIESSIDGSIDRLIDWLIDWLKLETSVFGALAIVVEIFLTCIYFVKICNSYSFYVFLWAILMRNGIPWGTEFLLVAGQRSREPAHRGLRRNQNHWRRLHLCWWKRCCVCLKKTLQGFIFWIWFAIFCLSLLRNSVSGYRVPKGNGTCPVKHKNSFRFSTLDRKEIFSTFFPAWISRRICQWGRGSSVSSTPVCWTTNSVGSTATPIRSTGKNGSVLALSLRYKFLPPILSVYISRLTHCFFISVLLRATVLSVLGRAGVQGHFWRHSGCGQTPRGTLQYGTA